MLSDQQFVLQFETLTLDPAYFNHIGHIRITWIYLQSLPDTVVQKKVAEGIKNYATSLGATDKFHATMTQAFVQLITCRFRQNKELSWGKFLEKNSDLVDDAKQVIGLHYSDDLLNSRSAQQQALEPDKREIK